MFRLTKKEWNDLRSQFVTLSDEDSENQVSNSSQIVTSSRKHRWATYLPYAFTEHGITMLATIKNLLDDKVDKHAEQQRWKTRERIGFKKL